METDHTHSDSCWRSLNKSCVEFKIREMDQSIIHWRNLAVIAQETLRKIKGSVDKLESVVTRAIKDER